MEPIHLFVPNMAGTWIDQQHAGYDADVSVFSFQAVKNLPTADSGMICFADPHLDEEVRKWSWMGSERIIWHPLHLRLTESDVDRVASVLSEIVV